MKLEITREEEILYMNILQYGETLQISKITNWFQWKDGSRPICESIERDHGSAPYYLCAPLLMKLEQHPEAARLQSDVWHAYTYALFFLGVIYMYRLLWELFRDRRTALLGTLMLFLTPRIFADGLYNNKDSVLMSLIIVMLFYGIRFDSGYLGAGISFVGISDVEPFKQYELFQNGR